MPTNIEIKARVHNFHKFRELAEKLSDTPVELIRQEDIFFHTPEGRFKLRILSPQRAQLVYYTRVDDSGPKRSDYQIYETGDPAGLQALLSSALDVRGVVRKSRYLYLAGQTRIHADEVEGLGHFMELEVVLRDGQSDQEGQAIAEEFMRKLEIGAEDLIEGAYMDLIESEKQGTGSRRE